MSDMEIIIEANRLLKKGVGSLDKVGDIIGISRKAIKRRADKLGYTYNKDIQQYIKDTPDSPIEITKVIKKDDAGRNTKIINPTPHESTKVIKKIKDVSSLEENKLSFEDFNNLKKVIDNIDVILDLISKKNIVLDLPLDYQPVKTTINCNSHIWEEFNRKCEELRYYNKSDLISLAFQDFIKKY